MTKEISLRIWHRATATVLIGFAALGASSAMAQNLVKNGDFTQFTAPATNNPVTDRPYTSFNTHDPIGAEGGNLTGWTQSNATTNNSPYRDGNVGVLMTGNDNDSLYLTPDALQSGDCCALTYSQGINAYLNSNNPGVWAPANQIQNTWDGRGPNGANYWSTVSNYYSAALSQTISLTANQQYTLSFAWAVGQNVNGIEHGWGGWNVQIGDQPVQVLQSAEIERQGFSGWSTYTYTFTASQSGPATLMFSPTGAAPQMDLLSNISVTAVPEPTTMLMFGLGLTGLMVLRRRTR